MLKTGIGRDRARKALAWAGNRAEPGAVLSTGCGGALTKELSTGDLAVAEEVVSSDGRAVAVSSAWRDQYQRAATAASVRFSSGRLLSLDTIVGSSEEKHRIALATRSFAVEMEAAAIGEWAIAAGAEFAAARVILDSAAMPLSPEIASMTTPDGSISFRRLVAVLARRPRLVAGLASLGAAARRCRASLAAVHRELVRNLDRDGLLRNDESSAKTGA